MSNNDLSKYACRNEDAIRFVEEAEDARPPFFHDADRIIYSPSFNRYIDKTQVFSFKENDHITRRITHVIMGYTQKKYYSKLKLYIIKI